MMRLLHVTCPFDPDYCCHYCIFPTRYLLYPPLPLALAFEVCLAGLMLIVAAPVDLVLGLALIVAIPLEHCGLPLALAFELCLAGLMLVAAAP